MKVRPRKSAAKKSPAGLIIVVLVVIAAAAAGGWYFFLRQGPESTVKAYLRASQTNDTAAMQATFSAESVKITAGSSKLGNIEKMAFVNGSAYSVGSARIDGDKATVPVKYKQSANASRSNAPQEVEIPFALVKEDGKWKIDVLGTAMGGMGAAMGEAMKGMGSAMTGAMSGKGGTRRPGDGGMPSGR